jgi:hypothetical protein
MSVNVQDLDLPQLAEVKRQLDEVTTSLARCENGDCIDVSRPAGAEPLDELLRAA